MLYHDPCAFCTSTKFTKAEKWEKPCMSCKKPIYRKVKFKIGDQFKVVANNFIFTIKKVSTHRINQQIFGLEETIRYYQFDDDWEGQDLSLLSDLWKGKVTWLNEQFHEQSRFSLLHYILS